MQKKSIVTLMILMLFSTLACQKQVEIQALPDIQIQTQVVPEYKEIKYVYQQEDDRLEWTTYELEHNQSVVKHRWQGNMKIQDTEPLFSAMIKTVFDPEKNKVADKIDTLTWGRIAQDNTQKNTEISKRLVVAAALSDAWDKTTGKVKTGEQINGWVKDLANQADIFFELPTAFKENDMEITISSVEKVLVSRADTLPYFEQIKQFDIKAEDLVPWDCQVWFRIKR